MGAWFDCELPAANLAAGHHYLRIIQLYLERAPMGRDPLRVRHELTELIQKQIDAIEKETFGGTTEAERREYDERRIRIDELHDELTRFKTAA